MIEAYERRTKATWLGLASDEGITTDAYSIQPVVTRIRGEDVSCVLLLKGQGRDDLFLKRQFGPNAVDRTLKSVAAHRAALAALSGAKGLTAPRVLTFDEAGGALLLARAPGAVAQELFEARAEDPVARADMLMRCGAWLAAFHGSRSFGARPVSMAQRLNPLKRARDMRKASAYGLADADEFDRALAVIANLAEELADEEEPFAVIHGDFHPGNLLLSAEDVSGIDFENTSPGARYADIANFLVTYGADFGANASMMPGHTVSRMSLDAFFEGYGGKPDDPLLRLHFLRVVLQKWSAVAANPLQRNAQSKRRYAGLRRIADHLVTTCRARRAYAVS